MGTMKKPRVAILTSRHAPMTVNPPLLEKIVKSLGASVQCVISEKDFSLTGCDLLINNLGPFYTDSALLTLVKYYNKGGIILHLGPRALTVPYLIEGNKPRFLPKTDAGLHAFGLPDTHIPAGDLEEYSAVHCTPRYKFLEDLAEKGEFPPLKDTSSLDVRVALKPARPDDLYASRGLVEARFEPACIVEDSAGRTRWAPVVRLDHFEKGSLIFINGTPIDSQYFTSTAGHAFLKGMIESSLLGRVFVDVQASYSRYYPKEIPEIKAIAWLPNSYHKRCDWEISIEVKTTVESTRTFFSQRTKWKQGKRKAIRCRLPRLEEGQYDTVVTIHDNDKSLACETTGFYVLSDEAINKQISKCPKTRLDANISPDFCLRNGQPWPMHGTTYVVSGLYRDCFQRVNAAQCDKEMSHLKSAGINVLRTGIWTGYEEVFNEDGTFKETSLRSLDAYFLTAAKYDLPVHLVFAAFVMNHWDRSRDPFHDPGMIRKIVRQFKQFMDRYKGWPNVVVDIINEPSYSPFRDGWMWQIARPMGSGEELKAWQKWLRRKYGAITRLRETWGMSAVDLPNWKAARVPEFHEFVTNYDGVAGYDGRVMITDFMEFATESFNQWCRRIREIVKKADPEMLVLLGRDETLRVPTQQQEQHTGNIDFTNWHQWHREGSIFPEYVLNRVRGVPICGQEMGALIYKDHRNVDRIDEMDCRNLLERKLLYCMGNWIHWQSHNDITMDNIKEAKLGLIRGDGTERPPMDMIRLISWLEDWIAPRLVGRREDLEDILIVHPTSVYYSSDHPLGYRAAMNCIIALHFHLKRQANLVIEPLFRANNPGQIGDPNLIIFPSPTLIQEETWKYLVYLMREKGKTVFISGALEMDPYWRQVPRLQEIGEEGWTENVATQEPLQIGEKRHTVTFRGAANLGLPGKALKKTLLKKSPSQAVIVLPVGKGRLIYSPIPVEMGDDMNPVVELYRRALEIAPVHPPIVEESVNESSSAHFIYPIRYHDFTMFTVINEGPESTIRFTDQVSRTPISVHIAKERGAKIFVSEQGDLLGAYLHSRLEVGDTVIEPGGELSLIHDNGRFVVFPGDRSSDHVVINSIKRQLKPKELFQEIVA